MNIIKVGLIPSPKVYVFTCTKCHAVHSAKREEIIEHQTGVLSTPCLTCGNQLYTSADRILS